MIRTVAVWIPLAGVVFLLSPSLASAKTPDGQTPAIETVCSEEEGRAYGLCVAYCEAKDCDDPDARAAPSVACDRLLDRYQALTGFAEPPCADSGGECVLDRECGGCAADEICDWITGECVPPSCRSDDDCGIGEVCDGVVGCRYASAACGAGCFPGQCCLPCGEGTIYSCWSCAEGCPTSCEVE